MKKIIYKIVSILERVSWGLQTYLKYKKNEHSDSQQIFESEFMWLWFKLNPNFNKGIILYQTHPQLNLIGIRPTLSRINNYKIFDSITTETKVLDIGGNIGFFSGYISPYVKSVDILEKDLNFVKLATLTKEYFLYNNLQILNLDVLKYRPHEPYDFIMSLAIHNWVGVNLSDYLKVILKFGRVGSLFLIESHVGEYDRLHLGDVLYELETKGSIILVKKGISDDDLGSIRDHYYFRKS